MPSAGSLSASTGIPSMTASLGAPTVASPMRQQGLGAVRLEGVNMCESADISRPMTHTLPTWSAAPIQGAGGIVPFHGWIVNKAVLKALPVHDV